MAVYSHSRLETFRKCPRQFYYKYVAKLPLEDAPDQREELDAVLRRWLTTYARSEKQVGARLRNRRG